MNNCSLGSMLCPSRTTTQNAPDGYTALSVTYWPSDSLKCGCCTNAQLGARLTLLMMARMCDGKGGGRTRRLDCLRSTRRPGRGRSERMRNVRSAGKHRTDLAEQCADHLVLDQRPIALHEHSSAAVRHGALSHRQARVALLLDRPHGRIAALEHVHAGVQPAAQLLGLRRVRARPETAPCSHSSEASVAPAHSTA